LKKALLHQSLIPGFLFKENFDIQNLANFSKKLALLVELTLKKQKFPKIPNLKINKNLSN
jgi:hypothetical protein